MYEYKVKVLDLCDYDQLNPAVLHGQQGQSFLQEAGDD